MSERRANPLSVIGQYKVIGTGVYNIAADPGRINAFVPLLTAREQKDAVIITQTLNERFGPEDEVARTVVQ